MKVKIIMDSGKEYLLNEIGYSADSFLNSFYDINEIPMGGSVKVIKNYLVQLSREGTIMINPSHISSIEIIK
ncbi:hypothetical protein [Halalkalibacter nanhaiisediminis]|uniref:Uncharacterized protein n=1 Tax=Halalkalibacter nanhaiisediminis TaxID=688079 RepID=A0A562QR76_9BACI|nr:hypothetical protein [Halalkalibacter nanhaiisediminis]TWI59232.1 hypothetical protein IQ10_00946 [Halalkalibacter nanhaiisediminis]TWI59234.1 hypothetical protein IQ10_00948 [Halalkalibacter nanhaiisediminis]